MHFTLCLDLWLRSGWYLCLLTSLISSRYKFSWSTNKESLPSTTRGEKSSSSTLSLNSQFTEHSQPSGSCLSCFSSSQVSTGNNIHVKFSTPLWTKSSIIIDKITSCFTLFLRVSSLLLLLFLKYCVDWLCYVGRIHFKTLSITALLQMFHFFLWKNALLKPFTSMLAFLKGQMLHSRN